MVRPQNSSAGEDDRQTCCQQDLAEQARRHRRTGISTGNDLARLSWLWLPMGSTATKHSHQMTKKTAMIEPICMTYFPRPLVADNPVDLMVSLSNHEVVPA